MVEDAFDKLRHRHNGLMPSWCHHTPVHQREKVSGSQTGPTARATALVRAHYMSFRVRDLSSDRHRVPGAPISRCRQGQATMPLRSLSHLYFVSGGASGGPFEALTSTPIPRSPSKEDRYHHPASRTNCRAGNHTNHTISLQQRKCRHLTHQNFVSFHGATGDHATINHTASSSSTASFLMKAGERLC